MNDHVLRIVELVNKDVVNWEPEKRLVVSEILEIARYLVLLTATDLDKLVFFANPVRETLQGCVDILSRDSDK